MNPSETQERFKRGAEDAGRFFTYIADFVGFTPEDAESIRETRFIIEKYMTEIVSGFYVRLLRFPATRSLFEKPDGSIDQEYLELRMRHQANFWRRAASGEYDEDFTRFVDYVGRSHTSNGADPSVYVPERYVIGMVSYMGQRITDALKAELEEIDHELFDRGSKAWNVFLMVLLEMLARSYGQKRDEEEFRRRCEIDEEAIRHMAVDTYERALGIARTIEYADVYVGNVNEIPPGTRKIIDADGISIGVFNHNGDWVALHNSCLHRGGPVCEGLLEENTLTCPWHGYHYDVRDGVLLLDRTSRLTQYPVDIRGGDIYIRVRTLIRDDQEVSLDDLLDTDEAEAVERSLAANEFLLVDLPDGKIGQVEVEGEPVAVYHIDGRYYATQAHCTHAGGPLSQGRLNGHNVICPWHDSCFDVRTGQATCGPATQVVRTYRVEVENDLGRVN